MRRPILFLLMWAAFTALLLSFLYSEMDVPDGEAHNFRVGAAMVAGIAALLVASGLKRTKRSAG